MKNFLLISAAIYGIGVSAVSVHGFFFLDMLQLKNAVANGSERAELRNRLNVAAEGNWILLGNLITVVSVGLVSFAKNDNEQSLGISSFGLL